MVLFPNNFTRGPMCMRESERCLILTGIEWTPLFFASTSRSSACPLISRGHSRKIAIRRDRARTFSCPRRVTEAGTEFHRELGHPPSRLGGRPAGSYRSFPPCIPRVFQASKNAQAGRSANGGADSRTMRPPGILLCARITRIRGGECLSITGCRYHVSISMHPRHAALLGMLECLSVRRGRQLIYPHILGPRKGPTDAAELR